MPIIITIARNKAIKAFSEEFFCFLNHEGTEELLSV